MAAGERSGTRGRIDAIAEIEALAGFPGRAPGTDAERRAARHAAGRLRGARAHGARGVRVHVAVLVRRARPDRGAGGGRRRGLRVLVGGGRGAGARWRFVLCLLDVGAGLPLSRRLFGRRASQNVVSPAAGGPPGVAAPRGPSRRGPHRASCTGPGSGASTPASPGRAGSSAARFSRSRGCSAAALACAVARLAGVDGVGAHGRPVRARRGARGRARRCWWTSGSPDRARRGRQRVGRGRGAAPGGAARRRARALRRAPCCSRARRRAAAPTACAPSCAGTGRDLPRDRTVILNLDEVGAGSVRFTSREGPLLAARSHVQLMRHLRGDRRRLADGPPPLDNRAASDGFAARSAGYPAITVTCRDEHGLAPSHHRRSDLPEHVDPAALAGGRGVLRGAGRAPRRARGPGAARRPSRARRWPPAR